eukprot:TRINITY_DN7212_c0_g1_i3.p1 TRINITY_DN7212_c0_g1~~TRINITY_DN7212_c0_g1_i3.p1  ORF type:complete len:311 (-),score=23.48 TRINITY_DN7212_c0_g1_i3:20-952(-)
MRNDNILPVTTNVSRKSKRTNPNWQWNVWKVLLGGFFTICLFSFLVTTMIIQIKLDDREYEFSCIAGDIRKYMANDPWQNQYNPGNGGNRCDQMCTTQFHINSRRIRYSSPLPFLIATVILTIIAGLFYILYFAYARKQIFMGTYVLLILLVSFLALINAFMQVAQFNFFIGLSDVGSYLGTGECRIHERHDRNQYDHFNTNKFDDMLVFSFLALAISLALGISHYFFAANAVGQTVNDCVLMGAQKLLLLLQYGKQGYRNFANITRTQLVSLVVKIKREDDELFREVEVTPRTLQALSLIHISEPTRPY